MTIFSESLFGNSLTLRPSPVARVEGEQRTPPLGGQSLSFRAPFLVGLLVMSLLPMNVQGQNRGADRFGNRLQTDSPSPAPGGISIPSASFPEQAVAPQNGESTQANSSGEAEITDDGSESAPSRLSAFYGRIAKGGFLMIPLAICSLVVIALASERLVALRRRRVIPRPFVRRFTECVEDGQLSYDEAAAICDEFDCPVAEVFHAAVKRWGRPVLEVEQAVMDAGDRVADSLRRFLRVFHAISNVAPLLGLLGTVLGMIEAFDMMATQEAAGRPELLASGISVALMTTAGGLTVAIPAYLAYIYFTSRADRYLGEIDRLCQQVIDSISAEGLQQANNSGRSSRKSKRAA